MGKTMVIRVTRRERIHYGKTDCESHQWWFGFVIVGAEMVSHAALHYPQHPIAHSNIPSSPPTQRTYPVDLEAVEEEHVPVGGVGVQEVAEEHQRPRCPFMWGGVWYVVWLSDVFVEPRVRQGTVGRVCD